MRWIACSAGWSEDEGPLRTYAFMVCHGHRCIAPTGHPILSDPDQELWQIKRWILYHEEDG